MGTSETHDIEIRHLDSIKEYFSGIHRKNVKLIEAILHFIDTHFNAKMGDILRITLEFEDYHGYECYISIEQFIPSKAQHRKRLFWNYA